MKPVSHLFLGVAVLNLALPLFFAACDKQSQVNANKNPAARAEQGGHSLPRGTNPEAAEGATSLGSPGGVPAGGPGTTPQP